MAKAVSRTITALIPYFGGESTAAPSKRENRFGYLQQTVASLRGFADRVIIGVCSVEDAEMAATLKQVVFQLDCQPPFLPATLCRYIQGQRNLVKSGLIYVTEADQVLHYTPQALEYVQGNHYLSPHRLEELSGRKGENRGLLVAYDKRLWVLPNGEPRGRDWYHPGHPIDQFGGGYLCTVELFRQVQFVDSNDMAVEHATGLDISYTGICAKTSDWHDFFVEHLSGKEYHDKL